MTQLITMAGKPNGALLNIDVAKLNDFEAGLVFLSQVGKLFPGQKLSDFSGKKMSGNWLGNFGNWVADKAGSVGDKLGDWGGSAIRLVTDQEVQQGATNAALAYQTGGKSEALKSILGSFGGGTTQNANSQISRAGADYKRMLGGFTSQQLILAGAGVLVLIVALKVIK